MPAYGQTGNVTVAVGFEYYLKNLKRGWTGIWYGETRTSTFQGSHDASYPLYQTFNDVNTSISHTKIYNWSNWYTPWLNDPYGALVWANGITANIWAYVTGTVTYDVCGSKTHQY
jgi:hypothetical protein